MSQPANPTTTHRVLLRGGRVYDHDGDVHLPPLADVLIVNDRIAAVGAHLQAPGARVFDAGGLLLVPGFVNAHYHSHDVLCRGLFEELPLDLWMLHTAPLVAGRTAAELRVRTLLGAVENLKCGVTTVQDMLTLAPLDDEGVGTVLAAYGDAGIRCVQAFTVQDVATPDAVPFLRDTLTPHARHLVGPDPPPAALQLDFVARHMAHAAGRARLHWALGPSAPQRCSRELLEGVAELASRHCLPVYTHVYETRAQAVLARERYGAWGGSLYGYLDACGLLNERLTVAHGVWGTRAELSLLAERGAGIALNPMSNLKLKSGIAPLALLRETGVRLALGSDNCSGSDVQSPFLAMRLYCGLLAVSDPRPRPPSAAEAVRLATEGGARACGLAGEVGALRTGMKADICLLDLRDSAWQPLHSAARQLVYAESGRGVHSVFVDGRQTVREGRVLTVDENALREELAGLMGDFEADRRRAAETAATLVPCYHAAHAHALSRALDIDRHLVRDA